jgi:predicted Kef-type K+ transport protein
MEPRYYAEFDGKRWVMKDRLEDGRVVGFSYSKSQPIATLKALNEQGYVDAD